MFHVRLGVDFDQPSRSCPVHDAKDHDQCAQAAAKVFTMTCCRHRTAFAFGEGIVKSLSWQRSCFIALRRSKETNMKQKRGRDEIEGSARRTSERLKEWIYVGIRMFCMYIQHVHTPFGDQHASAGPVPEALHNRSSWVLVLDPRTENIALSRRKSVGSAKKARSY